MFKAYAVKRKGKQNYAWYTKLHSRKSHVKLVMNWKRDKENWEVVTFKLVPISTMSYDEWLNEKPHVYLMELTGVEFMRVYYADTLQDAIQAYKKDIDTNLGTLSYFDEDIKYRVLEIKNAGNTES